MTDPLGPPADTALAAPGSPRLARRRARRPARRLGPDDPAHRAAARARLPVESLTGPAGGYRLAAGTAMPPLLLDDDEAIAIAVELRTAARASVAGIEETRAGAREARAGSSAAPPAQGQRAPGRDYDAPRRRSDRRPAVTDADCRRVPRLRARSVRVPRSRRGESRREVEPHSLVNLGRRWYLAAWIAGAGLANVPARPPIEAGVDRRAIRARDLPAKERRGVRDAEASPPRRLATRRGSRSLAATGRPGAIRRPVGNHRPRGRRDV